MKSNDRQVNLIITGVGGQGNVLISKLIGDALVNKGYFVTIGETYGASQRGGGVMSHIRMSREKQPSPLIPRGKGDVVIALEPVEALRVLAVYGNPRVIVLTNTHPILPSATPPGGVPYPEFDEIREDIDRLSKKAYYIKATKKAVQMGAPVLSNMIMIGALLKLDLIPLTVDEFRAILSETFDAKKLDVNLQAIDAGMEAVG
jgi:indolepyruvate ferredoxin oxidoreductase beta subunit